MSTLVLKGGLLIDGTGGAPLANSEVTIEDSQIVFSGEGSRVSTSTADAEVIDVSGKTVLPGLVNTHIHLCYDESVEERARTIQVPDAYSVLCAASNALRTLQAGVTTVRDLGAHHHGIISLQVAIDQGLVLGPRIVAAGIPICITSAHGFCGYRQADGPDDVRKAVREQVRAGAGTIKFIATGGVGSDTLPPDFVELTLEELNAGAEAARMAGRKTAAHAYGAEGIMNCLDAGIDSIEHGAQLTEDLIDRMVRSGTFLVPTLSAFHGIMTGGKGAGVSDSVIAQTQPVLDWQSTWLPKAIRAGVRIAVGTDAGSYCNPHAEIVTELQLLHRAGLSPMQAIVAATSEGAELMGLGKRIGTVEPGKEADIVVVDGNPLEDLACIRDVCLVIKAGRVVDRRS